MYQICTWLKLEKNKKVHKSVNKEKQKNVKASTMVCFFFS